LELLVDPVVSTHPVNKVGLVALARMRLREKQQKRIHQVMKPKKFLQLVMRAKVDRVFSID
jgi:hypothetical protein